MSSRGCTKTYSRKVNTVTPASIQFDKLFRENSNRPSAAKSAGTVGKWGITSFTSLRSTNINGRRDDIHGSFGAKRMKMDYGNQNARVSSGKDPFSFDTDAPDARTDSPAGATTAAAPVVKPKKFFKSRNVVAPPATEERDSAIYRQVPDSQISRGGRGHGKHQVTTAASAAVKSIQKSSLGSLATTSSSVAASGINAVGKKPIADPMEPSLEDSPSKPPIVLRICKGTAQLLCGDTQELAEPGDQQPDTYRITTPMTMSTKIMDMDRKSLVSETSASKERHRPVVTTVSIPLEHSDMRRTTRSRSKNLQLGEAAPTTTIPTFSTISTISTMSTTMVTPVVTSSPPPSPPAATISQTSGSSSSSSSSHGLSLTLRKSVTDSNNTLISHYDIVKTDGYSCKPLIEPLIGRDQPLPTTTQELIDILSSDSDPRPLVSNPPEEPQPQVEVQAEDEKPKQQELVEMEEDQEVEEEDEEEEEEEEEETLEPPKIKIKPVEPPPQVSEALPTPMTISETVTENTTTTTMTTTTATTTITSTSSTASPVTELQPLLPPPPPSAEVEEEKDAGAKSLVDQDWFSGSEDSETPPTSTPGTVGTLETVVEVTSAVKPLASTVKKGSIFKSRSAGATNGKRRALYKHKWSETNTSDGTTATGSTGSVPSAHIPSLETAPYTEEFEDTELTRVVTYSENDKDLDDDDDVGTECVRSVRCGKKVKRFYTVVKNVKKAHQIQESGEFQEFNDDVEYILDTLRENNPNATRCLSAIRLASKCMAPAFRMHVRAHGTVAKFFKALHDATKDQSLGLCTATVMFVLSQDRLAMDLDRDCLELMLSLLESDASHKDALDDCGLSRAELLKNKEKVRQLCADIQAQGHAKHLNLDNITVGQLAMETLLSLTSKRAGEWFKEELRELGGLEHIVKTIRDCHRNIDANDITRAGWSDPLLDKLRKVDRCLRVLENVTHMNEENQIYLLKYDDAVLVKTLASLYYLCGQEIVIYPTIDPSDKSSTGAVIRECLFAIIKVLINLTHRFNRQSFGSKSVGTQTGVIECSLHLILGVSDSLPEEKRFDMMMLGLILLINLVEQCDDNKKLLMELKSPSNIENIFDAEESGVEALIDLFYKQEELARAEEQKTDAILDGKKDSEQTETVSTTAKSQEEFIEETVTKLLQKAGRHMEHTLIGAYVVLLLGYLIMDNKDYELLVRNRLPDGNFATMVTVLQKFFNFMNLTASNEISSCGIAATEKVIKFLKMSDARIEEERNELPLPALEDSSSTATLDMTSP